MKNQKGSTLVLVMVFSIVFLTILGGVVSLVIGQSKTSQKRASWDMALHIAEAGANYYKWHLSHSPEDFCDGTEQGSLGCQVAPYGPFEHEYKDPEGNIVGKFSLIITPATTCCSATIIESRGWTLQFPSFDRIVKIWWGKPSLARYAFLTNANVWFGQEEELKGLFHANGGIRMDGDQNSLSTSGKDKYICGPEHGCTKTTCKSPCSWKTEGCECPGIWGEGEGSEKGLWSFPASILDFELIRRDLNLLQEKAEEAELYYGPSGSKYYGYHIKFLSTGQYSVYKVSRLKPSVWGWDGSSWRYESNDIDRETLLGTYNLPIDCAPIYFEDNVWIDGDISGRITVVAAQLPEAPSSMKKIVIHGNINYMDDNSALGLISQSDILIPLYSADRLEIKAALLAQNGRVMRYDYPKWSYEPYKTYAIREYIETYGSIITNKMWTFSWTDGEETVSGYEETEMSYNPTLVYNPPPYFPAYGDYEVFRWEEK
ncbi:MAG: hypothetical protein WC309_04305 [Candidatus Paceibacterota bacterium]|jgi:hypothetical protein